MKYLQSNISDYLLNLFSNKHKKCISDLLKRTMLFKGFFSKTLHVKLKKTKLVT